jgi:RimJ/RimL family protein N-acetyltransferase
MGDSKIELIAISGGEADRLAAGTPGEHDNWAEGFPRKDDRDVAAVLAAMSVLADGADPDPFGSYRLVALAHGQTIGTAGFYGPPDESGQVIIGYGMVDRERGNGYGTEAVACLIEICRRAGGVSAILADTELDNVASQRVLEKNGFARVRTTDESHFFMLDLS